MCLKLRHKRRAGHFFHVVAGVTYGLNETLLQKQKQSFFSMQFNILIDRFIRILSLLVDQNKKHF